jgi:hypothetical protein
MFVSVALTARRLLSTQRRAMTAQQRGAAGVGSLTLLAIVFGRGLFATLYFLLGGGTAFWAVVLGALALVALVAVYAIWVRVRAASAGGASMQMTPAMAVAGVADGQPGAYASVAGFSAPGESSWAPVAPSMPADVSVPQAEPALGVEPTFGVEPAQQFAPQPMPAPAPDFEFVPAPTSVPAPAPQQAKAAVPAPPQVMTAGGRIQVHCPACGAGNAVANRTCIMCRKKLPPVS